VAEGGPTVIIDWIDALRFAGGSFSANGATTTRAELGPQVGNVQCRIGDVVNDSSYKLQDGDAIRWPPGTPIFSVAGYPSSCRLAVTEGATVWVYELSDPSASVATAAPCPRAN
jgi:hypothetical protein